MKPFEAEDVANKLAHSWPRSSITITSWVEELVELDKGRAEETTRQLIRNAEHAPSIAAFLSTYRNLAGTAKDGPKCPDCDGTGWVTDTNHPSHWPGDMKRVPPIPASHGPADPCLCNVVKPCSCDDGAHAHKHLKRTERRNGDFGE
jgi:hypothetical protein